MLQVGYCLMVLRELLTAVAVAFALSWAAQTAQEVEEEGGAKQGLGWL